MFDPDDVGKNTIEQQNHRIKPQWYHQVFFSVTEVVSSAQVLLLADRQVGLTVARTLPVVTIAFIHILASCSDQFFHNVLQGEGYSYQVGK
ncbi:hypothetical protein J6590_101655 [Homalodisca vitripennis]|nr:hypothetical protein J6590_081348 [Homalodisca vitripennis]KAG8279582.1 hypothetical protein J6590_101655 [Homalodisca vitripennis]